MRSQLGIKLISGFLVLAWPFLIWFGLSHHSMHWLLPLLVLVLILRVNQARQNAGPMRFLMMSVALAGIALCSASYVLKNHQLLLFYPVVVNLVMLVVFGCSIWTDMSVVERLARLREPDLPPAGVLYTRRVTQIWCVFFIVNGAIALFTALHGDMQIWTLWNGLLSYFLMGTLMAGEWLIRRRIMKQEIK